VKFGIANALPNKPLTIGRGAILDLNGFNGRSTTTSVVGGKVVLGQMVWTAGASTFTDGSELGFTLGSLSAFGQFNSSSTLTLNDSTKINVSLATGYTPSVGNVFDIIDYTTLAGAGSFSVLPTTAGGNTYNWTFNNATGEITLASVAPVLPPNWWVGPTDSNTWNSTSSWKSGTIPHVAGDVALFNGDSVGSSTVLVDAPITVGELNFTTTATASYDIQSSGDNSLTLQGAGGNAKITLGASAANQTISVPLILASDLTINNGSTNSLTVSGGISDGGTTKSVTVSNGLVIFGTTASSYTGGTNITGGTLQMNLDNALYTSGSMTMSGGTLDLNGHPLSVGTLQGTGGTIKNAGASATLTVTQGADQSFTGKLYGTGLALIKAGGSKLTLSPSINNDFSGGTTLSAGTLALAPATNGTVVLGAVTMNAGTLSGFGTVGAIDASGAASGAKIMPAAGQILTTGTLTLNSNMTLDFTNYVSASSGAMASTGTLNVVTPGLGGDLVNVIWPTSLATGSTYTLLNASGAGNATTDNINQAGLPTNYRLTIDTGGDLILQILANYWKNGGSSNWSSAGNWTLGIPQMAGDTASFTNDGDHGTLSVNLDADNIKVGTVLFGASAPAYTISTDSNKTLTLDGGGSGGSVNAAITVGSGAGNQIISTPIALNSNVLVTNNATGSSLTLSGGIGNGSNGAKGLTLAAGTLIMGGTNIYTGATTLNGGTLKMNSENAAPAGSAFAFAGGVFDMNTYNQAIGALSGASGKITNSGSGTPSLTVNQTADGTFTGQITGGVSLVKSGGSILTLSGTTNNYSGTTSIVNGGLKIGVGGALPATTSVSMTGGTLDLNNIAQSLAGLSGNAGTVTSSGNTLTITGGGTFNGRITGGLALTMNGAGQTLTLNNQNTASAANNFTGALTVSAGTLRNGYGNQITDTPDVHVNVNAVWDLNGQYEKIAGFKKIGNATYGQAGGINVNGGTLELAQMRSEAHYGILGTSGWLIIDGSDGYASNENKAPDQYTYWPFTGNILINSGGLLQAMNKDVSQSNYFLNASDIYLNGGTLTTTNQAKAGLAMAPTTRIHMTVGTYLLDNTHHYDSAFYDQTVAVLEGTGTVSSVATASNATLTVNQASGSYEYSGVLTNSGAYALNIVKDGAGTWTLSGSSNYMGTTLVRGGALVVGNNSALGSATSAVNLGDASSAGTIGLFINGGITLGRTINVNAYGTGTTIGGTNITGTATYSNTITLGQGVYLSAAGGGTVNFQGDITGGAYNVTKTGAGTVVLTGAKSYSGNTMIEQGTLALGAGGSIASSTIAVGADSFFDVSIYGPGGYTLGSTQTLKGHGTVLGSINILGTAAPGGSIGTLTMNNGTISGTLDIELASASSYDKLVADNLTLALGSTLHVSLLDGYDPAQDTIFDIITVTGALTDGGVIFDLPTFSDGRSWKTWDDTGTKLSSTGQIQVIPEPATIALMGLGLAGLVSLRRRSRKA